MSWGGSVWFSWFWTTAEIVSNVAAWTHFEMFILNKFESTFEDDLLKKLIIEKNRSKQQVDFDLEITNADTNEIYKNENDMVMKNTRVNVKRVVKSSNAPLRAQPPKPTQPTHQEAQIAARAPNTAASSAAMSYSNTAVSSSSAAPVHSQQPSKPFVNTVSSNVPSQPQTQLTAPTATSTTIPSTISSSNLAATLGSSISNAASSSVSSLSSSSATIAPTPQPSAVSNGSDSGLAPSTSTATTTSSNPLPKAVYDSLAPLNLPSKPIVYVAENADSQPSSSSNAGGADQSKASSDDSREDEKAKLESILLSSQMAAGFKSGPGGGPGDMMGKFGGQGNWPRPRLFTTYRCPICKKPNPNHPKHLCPEAANLPVAPNKQEERVYVNYKHPSGIPKSKMVKASPQDKFAMLGPDGYVVPEIEHEVAKIVKKERAQFLTEEEEEELKLKQIQEGTYFGPDVMAAKIPRELKCPFGDHIIKDAVLVPCCGHFICCDECIRAKISNYEDVECPHAECDQEIGALESITPDHKMRKMVNDYLNDIKMASQRALASSVTSSATSLGSTSMTTGKSGSDIFFDLLLDETVATTTVTKSNNDDGESASPAQFKENSSITTSAELILNINEPEDDKNSPFDDLLETEAKSPMPEEAEEESKSRVDENDLVSSTSSNVATSKVKNAEGLSPTRSALGGQQPSILPGPPYQTGQMAHQQGSLLPTPGVMHPNAMTGAHPPPHMQQMQTAPQIPIIDMTQAGNYQQQRGMMNPPMMNSYPMQNAYNQQQAMRPQMMRPGMMNHGYPQQQHSNLGQPMRPMGMGMPQQPMYNQPPYNQQQPNPGGYMNRPPFYPNQPMNMMNDGSGVPGNPNMYNQQPLLNHQLPPMNPTAGGGGPIRQQPNMMPPGIPPNQMYPNSSTNLNQNMMNKSMMPPHAMMQPPSLLSHPLQLHAQQPMSQQMPGAMGNPGVVPNVGVPGMAMPPGIPPHQGMMPQAMPGAAGPPGIMSKEEFYKYQEKLRKDAEMQKYKKYSRRTRSRSRSRSRGGRSYSRSYSRSRSRTPYSGSRSRSRTCDSRSPRSVDSRGSPVKRYRVRSRSRNRTRSRSRTRSPNRPNRRYAASSSSYNQQSSRYRDRDHNRDRDRGRGSHRYNPYPTGGSYSKHDRKRRSGSRPKSNQIPAPATNTTSDQYRADRDRNHPSYRRTHSRSRSKSRTPLGVQSQALNDQYSSRASKLALQRSHSPSASNSSKPHHASDKYSSKKDGGHYDDGSHKRKEPAEVFSSKSAKHEKLSEYDPSVTNVVVANVRVYQDHHVTDEYGQNEREKENLEIGASLLLGGSQIRDKSEKVKSSSPSLSSTTYEKEAEVSTTGKPEEGRIVQMDSSSVEPKHSSSKGKSSSRDKSHKSDKKERSKDKDKKKDKRDKEGKPRSRSRDKHRHHRSSPKAPKDSSSSSSSKKEKKESSKPESSAPDQEAKTSQTVGSTHLPTIEENMIVTIDATNGRFVSSAASSKARASEEKTTSQESSDKLTASKTTTSVDKVTSSSNDNESSGKPHKHKSSKSKKHKHKHKHRSSSKN